MVVLNRIYTRTGDGGTTSLGNGEVLPKFNLRIEAYGTVDEANSMIGLARQATSKSEPLVDAMLHRIQNDLFDLGADLCTPDRGDKLEFEPLRIIQAQVDRLEAEIDELNSSLEPLRSFVLPGGSEASAALHVARTVARRAERLIVELSLTEGESVGGPALKYINRLSDFLVVAARYVNSQGKGDILWVPGKNR